MNSEALRICRASLTPVDSWVDAHRGQSDADVLRQYLCFHDPHKLGAAAYLESSNPANNARYEAVGFRTRASITMDSGHIVTTMWRAGASA